MTLFSYVYDTFFFLAAVYSVHLYCTHTYTLLFLLLSSFDTFIKIFCHKYKLMIAVQFQYKLFSGTFMYIDLYVLIVGLGVLFSGLYDLMTNQWRRRQNKTKTITAAATAATAVIITKTTNVCIYFYSIKSVRHTQHIWASKKKKIASFYGYGDNQNASARTHKHTRTHMYAYKSIYYLYLFWLNGQMGIHFDAHTRKKSNFAQWAKYAA